ncbi:MAG: FHA domain-containing protein [Deltaproteobacteria bacterium]|nr:FHA domain-containing protein [Deltaproteobacteria bacterium]
MSVSPKTLEMVSCPQCQGELKLTKEEVLFCVHCRLCYPVEEGVPHLSVAAALELTADGKVKERKVKALFAIESGPDLGTHFMLEEGSCKAIGRQIEDTAATQVFNVDFTMTLDDHTKKLIMNYLSKGAKKKEGKDLGAYSRDADLILNDPKVSRLHAMIFFDETGAGILDLVSRNGTFVNGREVETCRLKPGDEIRLGETVVKFSMR